MTNVCVSLVSNRWKMAASYFLFLQIILYKYLRWSNCIKTSAFRKSKWILQQVLWLGRRRWWLQEPVNIISDTAAESHCVSVVCKLFTPIRLCPFSQIFLLHLPSSRKSKWKNYQ